MREPFNILVAGIGGQGNLVCGRIVAEAALLADLRPTVADTFGASRRGGSVLTHLRIGQSEWGPLVPKTEADIIIGLEPMEGLRACIEFGGERTTTLLSNLSRPVVAQDPKTGSYPSVDRVFSAVRSIGHAAYLVDVKTVADEFKPSRTTNAFMLGVMGAAVETPLTTTDLRTSVERILSRDRGNVVAFDRGTEYGESLTSE
ncbi:MAG: 2-oxoacid:acceptor oxidoreductase family protein [Candidatus Thorarchaeota archaeon]|nr:MAG: hypothetical protein DRP09_04915 [Candidatus Thorarchaeota archaeon]RLI58073.1 MAG: hypothetical protein DRO87_06310 [Candidatus Thorarchaeota archaeon]